MTIPHYDTILMYLCVIVGAKERQNKRCEVIFTLPVCR